MHTNKLFFKVALPVFASLLFLMVNGSLVSALTYQNSTKVQFTFNPAITISLSSPNLSIDNLTPGSSGDSNIVTVGVSTNAGYGYYMSATAGTSTGNTNLTSTTSGNVFTNLSSNKATLSAFSDNTWGYSYSTDNGSTWISGSKGSTSTGYNGLPLDGNDSGATGVILASTDSFTNSGSVKFKIGAKAAATQASGTYTNTVNFYVVANPEPEPLTIATATTMQEVMECPDSLTTEQIYTIKDARDNQDYKVAKLADGKCWMLENLNLAGGTALSSSDTDFDSSYELPTNDGWSVVDGKLVLPASGEGYFNNSWGPSVLNSGNKTGCGANGQNSPCYSYYSWSAATVGSGVDINEDSIEAPYSICPKGWRLPTSRKSTATNWQNESEVYILASHYGYNSTTSTSEIDNDFLSLAGPGTVPNLILNGFYQQSNSVLNYGGRYGYLWTATASTTYVDPYVHATEPGALYVYFGYNSAYTRTYTYLAEVGPRSGGQGVRCVFDD